MCGRYSIGNEIEQLARQHQLKVPDTFAPAYNAAPGQELPVFSMLNQNAFNLFHWGIHPFWAKSERQRLINARAETIAEKVTFKEAFSKRRCLVAGDGYYEWMKASEGKVPYRICLRDEQPFFFAGIWEQKQDYILQDFAIITTRASPSIAHIHDRMPVILQHEAIDFWLSDTEDIPGLLDILRPLEDRQLKAYQVSKKVNWVGNNSAGLREIVA
jgi:putative SOS response-associated peptidase YedK